MRGKWALQIGIAGMLAMLLAGCAGLQKEKGPIVLTLWHVYGGQTDSPLNRTIDRFNETRGRELGIQVQVTSVSNTNTIHEAVLSAARKEPGGGGASGYVRLLSEDGAVAAGSEYSGGLQRLFQCSGA